MDLFQSMIVTALPQLNIPEGDFNEWTFSEEAVVPFIISPISGQNQGDTPQQSPAIFLLNDNAPEQPALINATGKEISASNGFRLVQKIVVIEQAGPTADATSADNGSVIASAGNASQQLAASNGLVQSKALSNLTRRDKLMIKITIGIIIGIMSALIAFDIFCVIGCFFCLY